MSENAEKNLEIVRGEPILIKIGAAEETVKRLSISDQIGVMDLIMEGGDASNKFAIERMIKIISTALKREISMEDFSSAAQIVGAFNKIWTQNEFDFLLVEVGKVRLKAN